MAAIPTMSLPLTWRSDGLGPGARVEVRSRFDGSWVDGFEMAEATPEGCHVRRLADGNVLPLVFPHDEVRRP
jgi:hypothetical protein